MGVGGKGALGDNFNMQVYRDQEQLLRTGLEVTSLGSGLMKPVLTHKAISPTGTERRIKRSRPR